jgi:hypothetical protein
MGAEDPEQLPGLREQFSYGGTQRSRRADEAGSKNASSTPGS